MLEIRFARRSLHNLANQVLHGFNWRDLISNQFDFGLHIGQRNWNNIQQNEVAGNVKGMRMSKSRQNRNRLPRVKMCSQSDHNEFETF